MPSSTSGQVPSAAQPRARDYGFDIERALSAVVGLHSTVPQDAFTAETLGVERAGNGVLIGDGLVLTIGYLVMEAETVWIHLHDDRVVQGHVLGIDSESGFGLVQALEEIDIAPLPLGDSDAAKVGDRIVVAGAGGRTRALAGQIAVRQEFAGYWEYLLDEAIFTHPSHPNWGGAALLSAKGEVIGIGSLQIEREGSGEHFNMIVPINLLKPVLDDLMRYGAVSRPARPWLGLYASEIDDQIVILGVADKGPAARSELKSGDIVLAVNGDEVTTLADFYRAVWALGSAGVDVPLTIFHEGITFDVVLVSVDRLRLLKTPRLH